jgi:hypothetical protein
MAEIVSSAPEPPALPGTTSPSGAGSGGPGDVHLLDPQAAGRPGGMPWLRGVAAVVVVGLLVGGGLLVWSRGTDPVAVTTAPSGPSVTVRHEVLEYAYDGPHECAVGGQWHDGPTTLHVETWTDPVSDTWRQDITADDGSTQSQIDVGLNGMWRETYRRGAVYPASCSDPELTGPVDSPARYLLNTTQSGRPATISAMSGPGGPEVIAEATTDSRGRPAKQLRVTDRYAGVLGSDMDSFIDYYLDPTGTTVLETVAVRTIGGRVDYSERVTLDSFEVITVDSSAFSTDDYDHVRVAGNTPSTGVPASRDQRSCFTALDLTTICLTREGQTLRVVADGLRPGSELVIGLNTGREQRSATLTVDGSGRVPETDLFTVLDADDRVWVATATGTHSSGVGAGGLLSLGA